MSTSDATAKQLSQAEVLSHLNQHGRRLRASTALPFPLPTGRPTRARSAAAWLLGRSTGGGHGTPAWHRTPPDLVTPPSPMPTPK